MSSPEHVELLRRAERPTNGRYGDPSVPPLHFRDHSCPRKRIDFVLAYKEHSGHSDSAGDANDPHCTAQGRSAKREEYRARLRNYGIDIEDERFDLDGRPVYIWKLHGQFDALCDWAEDVKLRKEVIIQESRESKEKAVEGRASWWSRWVKDMNPFVIRDNHCKDAVFQYKATFDKRRIKLFKNCEDQENFFTHCERTRLVYWKCTSSEVSQGLEDLIADGTFTNAYPLHQGPLLEDQQGNPTNPRQELQRDWASWSRAFKYQPITAIKDYFGEKIGLYFCWLGFYTTFLVPAALVGILCFVYGIASSFNFVPANEICQPKDEKLVYHCPLCDKYCSYFLLSKTSCLYARVTHFFDNEATLIFAIFMSFWSTMFLEFWKRKQATLACEWHTTEYEEGEEKIRPQYTKRATGLRLNKVTLKEEPFIPITEKAPRLAGVIGIVVFFVCLVIASLVGVMVYRAVIYAALLANGRTINQSRARMVVAGSAATINLIVLVCLRFVYFRLARSLTNWEGPRTFTDFENSFTIKMFLFEFVNTYSSIFYVAFFKSSQFVGRPGHYKRVGNSGIRLEGCPAEGCFLELCIQVIVIMLGQQVIGSLGQILGPRVKKCCAMRSLPEDFENCALWQQDYFLDPREELSLFWEYLEMVLQYCFVTMFVAAFPLAPLFALINNIFEIRTDAINFLCNFQRPVPLRAEDIGAWYSILATLTELAVLINALVIAFSTELIPRIVYAGLYSPDGSLHGYLNFSMSYFNVSQFSEVAKPKDPLKNVPYTLPYCRYPGFRISSPPYSYRCEYFVILAVRLAFVFFFQWTVTGFTRILAWVISDVPGKVKLQKRREAHCTREAIIDFKEREGDRKMRFPSHHVRSRISFKRFQSEPSGSVLDE